MKRINKYLFLDGPKIPKSKMGIIIKELKAMFPAADGKQIADLVKSCVV